MKKLIIITALTMVSIGAFAQAKNDTAKAKPVYEKFYKVDPRIMEFLLNQVHAHMDAIKYIKTIPKEQKTDVELALDANIELIQKNVKLDSVLVKK